MGVVVLKYINIYENIIWIYESDRCGEVMKLDIDSNSLHDMLQGKKDYIGGSWINGIVYIIEGLSFVITIYSAKISIIAINILLYIMAFFLVGIGSIQFWKNSGKRRFDYEKLYNDIKALSSSESQYSLIAILNDFEGDSANKVLLRYYPNWNTYMFLSFRSSPEDNENNVITRVAASLKIARSDIDVKFLSEIPYQPKYSPAHKSKRLYHNKYYQISISKFSDILKREEFILDGIKYKWMTLEEMWENDQIKKNNSDVLKEFEKYIFNKKKQCGDKSLLIPSDIYIRLNRTCNLSCSFCLANNKSQGLSTEQIKIILDELQLLGIKRIKLTGGEPTLRSDFFEIVTYSIKLGMNPVIYSNLFVSNDIIKELIKYQVPICTSIHGDEDFHDTITEKGAYRKTYLNISKLVLEQIPVTIHMVIMNKNFNLAETVINDAIKAGIKQVTFQTLIPREKGKELFEKDENIREIREKLKSLYPLKEKYASEIQINFSDLYEKDCYVVETDGAIYLEKEDDLNDKYIKGLI